MPLLDRLRRPRQHQLTTPLLHRPRLACDLRATPTLADRASGSDTGRPAPPTPTPADLRTNSTPADLRATPTPADLRCSDASRSAPRLRPGKPALSSSAHWPTCAWHLQCFLRPLTLDVRPPRPGTRPAFNPPAPPPTSPRHCCVAVPRLPRRESATESATTSWVLPCCCAYRSSTSTSLGASSTSLSSASCLVTPPPPPPSLGTASTSATSVSTTSATASAASAAGDPGFCECVRERQ
jgi:hypothetical protein